jgi:predicted RNase H-like HicB family nuclease
MNTSFLKINFDEAKGLRIETKIQIEVEKKERNWIAFSPDFKTVGFSTESKDAAIEDLKGALKTFFKVHLKRDTLERTLINFKWEKADHAFIGPPRFNLDAPDDVIQESLEFAEENG